MFGIAILSIVLFRAAFLHSSTFVNSFFLKENEGNLFSLSEAAHGPYKPITLGCCSSNFLLLILEVEGMKLLKSEANVFSMPVLNPRLVKAVCFRNSRRLFFISNIYSVYGLKPIVLILFSNPSPKARVIGNFW